MEIVRRLYAANRSGPAAETIDVALELGDPEGEFQSRLGAVEGRSYRGREGVHAYYADMAAAFREWRNEVENIVEVRPGVVVADSRFHGVGRESGMEVELRSGIVFSVSDEGKITGFTSFPTRAEAMAAALPAD